MCQARESGSRQKWGDREDKPSTSRVQGQKVAVVKEFVHPGDLTLMAERQSARMSKITNDGLTRYGT